MAQEEIFKNDTTCKSSSICYKGDTVELEISDFYGDVLKELCLVSRPKFCKIRESLTNIRSYKNPDSEKHGTVLFDNKYDRLAYIFAYGVIHSVIMYDRFSSLLKCNPSMQDKIAHMKTFNLCILGGGPAFEAVSMCKVFSNTLSRCKGDQRSPLDIHVTVVDMYLGWEEDAEFILDSAQNHLYDSKNVKVHFKFIEADLTSDFTEDVKRAIQSAHFVTMYMLLSDVNEASYAKQEIGNMIHHIIDSMSFKACLFFLDTSGGGLFNKMDKTIDEMQQTFRIYGPCLYNCHFLSIDSKQKFSEALSPFFRFLNCTFRSTVSCSAWIKVRNVIGINGLHSTNGHDCLEISKHPKEQKLKKKSKNRMKRVVQSPVKFKELYCNGSGTDSESSD